MHRRICFIVLFENYTQWDQTEKRGDACGVMVIIVGNGHGDTSSNPGQDWLHFT